MCTSNTLRISASTTMNRMITSSHMSTRPGSVGGVLDGLSRHPPGPPDVHRCHVLPPLTRAVNRTWAPPTFSSSSSSSDSPSPSWASQLPAALGRQLLGLRRSRFCRILDRHQPLHGRVIFTVPTWTRCRTAPAHHGRHAWTTDPGQRPVPGRAGCPSRSDVSRLVVAVVDRVDVEGAWLAPPIGRCRPGCGSPS